MNCCANCFGDQVIKEHINRNTTRNGVCDYCKTINAELIECTELYDYFVPIIGIYKAPLEDENQSAIRYQLWQIVKRDWPSLFRVSDEQIQILLKSILYDYDNLIFQSYVVPSYRTDEVQEAVWQQFTEEIKNVNRFFINSIIDTELLRELLSSHVRPHRRGKCFYRSRISSRDKLECDEMGKPPYELATAGRANPKGISYLYVSNDEITTLYETRASLLDHVTVATFRLADDLNIIDLKDENSVSPILLEDSIEKYMSYRNYLLKLGQELSKPIRKQDSELDYLPTQYLCEFIKSLGYDGVEYKSSLNPNGFNLAIFNDNKLRCTSTKLVEVKAIQYEMYELE